jgi:DNA-binding NtrC family response regulator
MSGLRRHDSTPDSSIWLREAMHDSAFDLDRLLRMVEKEAIALAMREHDGNVSKAAESLGINRTTLYGRMDRLEDTE